MYRVPCFWRICCISACTQYLLTSNQTAMLELALLPVAPACKESAINHLCPCHPCRGPRPEVGYELPPAQRDGVHPICPAKRCGVWSCFVFKPQNTFGPKHTILAAGLGHGYSAWNTLGASLKRMGVGLLTTPRHHHDTWSKNLGGD